TRFLVRFTIAIPRKPRSLSVATDTCNAGLPCSTRFDTRRTWPLFSKTKILLLSINAILVGEDKPATTVSTFRFGSFVIKGAAIAVEELWIKYTIGITTAKDARTTITMVLFLNDFIWLIIY